MGRVKGKSAANRIGLSRQRPHTGVQMLGFMARHNAYNGMASRAILRGTSDLVESRLGLPT